MMQTQKWTTLLASAVGVVGMLSIGAQVPGGCAVEGAAKRIAGFHPSGSVAVEQAVDLMKHGQYSLAFLRMSSEQGDTSPQAQARVMSAYALLVAGNTLGAFAEGA